MANIKITALPAASGVTADDVLPIVNAPATTPTTQKATAAQFKTFATTDINTATDFKVNTDKFVVEAATGDTTIGGTLTLHGVTYTWPASAGSSGYGLQTNGNGTLSWAAQLPASTYLYLATTFGGF